MATILLTWELGGGLGHLMNLRPIAAELVRRGHRVFAALRDLSQAREMLGDSVVFLQAPFKHQRMQEIHPCCTFAHILHNVGFCNVDELTTMTGAWRQLFEFVRPDLIVFDHSPTAPLAARGIPARKALIGTNSFQEIARERSNSIIASFSVQYVESVCAVSRLRAPCFLPAVRITTQMAESNRGIGVNLKISATGAMGECKILS